MMKPLRGSSFKKFIKSKRREIATKASIRFMLYSVGYPVNVGSLFRLAEGLAVERMYLVGGTARPEGINFNRASRGSERRIGWEIIEEVEKVGELISRLKREGYKVVAIELTGESVRFDQYQYG